MASLPRAALTALFGIKHIGEEGFAGIVSINRSPQWRILKRRFQETTLGCIAAFQSEQSRTA
jgi:hypothetical protein